MAVDRLVGLRERWGGGVRFSGGVLGIGLLWMEGSAAMVTEERCMVEGGCQRLKVHRCVGRNCPCGTSTCWSWRGG